MKSIGWVMILIFLGGCVQNQVLVDSSTDMEHLAALKSSVISIIPFNPNNLTKKYSLPNEIRSKNELRQVISVMEHFGYQISNNRYVGKFQFVYGRVEYNSSIGTRTVVGIKIHQANPKLLVWQGTLVMDSSIFMRNQCAVFEYLVSLIGKIFNKQEFFPFQPCSISS